MKWEFKKKTLLCEKKNLNVRTETNWEENERDIKLDVEKNKFQIKKK